MMNRGRFDDLVDSIELRFADRPAALAGHTWLWLLMGYAVVVLLTAVLIGGGLTVFLAGVFQPGVGVVLVIAGGILMTFGLGQVGALVLIDTYEPKGRPLRDDEAPELHKLITLLRSDLDCPSIHQVLLTEDFNAAIVQTPRLGIFGWSRSWLILGLPLLLAMSTQETASVLAHEFGHISKRHGRQRNRIYRLHQSWEKLFVKLQQNSGSGFVRVAGTFVLRFLNWYWPRFHALAFVLSRQNEFMADGIAVEATNAEFAASALWRMNCTGYMLENGFWKDLWAETGAVPEPPGNLCERLTIAYREAPAAEDAERWCDWALRRVTNNDDTHPSLFDRLNAIGVSTRQLRSAGFPPAPVVSAADGLLTGDLKQIEEDINQRWRTNVLSIWQDRHRRISAIDRLSHTAKNRTSSASNNAAELWKQTRNILDIQGLDAAEPNLRRLLKLKSDHIGATLALGQLRLSQGHDDGEDLLQHVLSLQTAEWTQAAGDSLASHFSKTGQRSALRQVRQQMDDFEAARAEAEKERTEILRGDVFTAHELNADELKRTRSALLGQEHCLLAWLVQKEMTHFPEERLYVVCVDSNTRAGSSLRAERNDRMITSLLLELELPGRPFIVNPTGEFKAVAGRIMKKSEWQIFDRSRQSSQSLTAE
ncbi:MAG: M48 family metalloprotease [Fuerstiella sp.]|nr:M48 family metalloprotease [Fuerstiella sp.]